MLTYFDPQPPPSALPPRFPSPFDAPHPLARRAAEELVRSLGRWDLDAPGAGKMFGVLVVRDRSGRLGYLRAFSGMLDGRWLVDGFVPPAFDGAARDAFWPAGEAELAEIAARLAAIEAEVAPIEAALAALEARQAAEAEASRAEHAARKAARRAARSGGADPRPLDQASRADGAAQRALKVLHAAERAQLAGRRAALDAARRVAVLERAAVSRGYLERLQETYELRDARGARRELRALFAPEEPPGGAGDCAGPKLLAQAYRAGLVPIALAEVWWGAPPLAGGRHAGRLYPACRGKCGPILAHMLGGLEVEPAPLFGADPEEGALRIVYEDAWLVVCDKPAGLLTVPGRGAQLADCLLARLRARYPGALVAHRLDLDTSGLVIAAKDMATHAALQQRFSRREIGKRYAAVLERAPRAEAGAGGVIELALRVDLEDRPRQIHDPVHGKPALTTWRLVRRMADGRARVELSPQTGRTHQLRVHAAHPLGLDAPIAGDRLYGRAAPAPAGAFASDADEALLLRAVSLALVHPVTGAALEIEAPPDPRF